MIRQPKIAAFFRLGNAGSVAIEFALVAPIVFLLLMGSIEFGLITATMVALEGATNIGSRLGKTGYSEGEQSREQFIRKEVLRLSGGFVDAQKLAIDILTYDSFANVGKPEPCLVPPVPRCPGQPGVNFTDINGNGAWDEDMGASGAGGGGAVVLYRVSYPWNVATPLLAPLIGAKDGVYTIQTVATVRNEPF